jgi:hypothetical protein
VSFGEVALMFFGFFLLIGPFGRLEYFICKTLESVAVSGLVLFPGGGKYRYDLESLQIDGTICFPLLIVALG